VRNKTILIQAILFVATVVTTTLSGAESITGKFFFFLPEPYALHFPEDFWQGFAFSIPFLGILTVHEFGHYFMAKYYKIKTSLPYYIPMWLGPFMMSIGTLGAVIRILDRTRTRKQYFDIGIAGPLAGFVVAMGVLWYGFTHLPPIDYIYHIHPDYLKYGTHYAEEVMKNEKMIGGQLVLGDNLLFTFFKNYVADPALVPPNFEMMHYPFIWAGYLALFFTALNLFPIGQLDGGHILYGLIGKKRFQVVSPIIYVLFVLYAGYGLFSVQTIRQIGQLKADYASETDFFQWLLLYVFGLRICFSRINPENKYTAWILSLGVIVLQLVLSTIPAIAEKHGFSGFFPFLFLLGRVLGVYHPDVEEDQPLDWKRQVLGWLALLIFVLCFTPHPFMEVTF
jgi:membrane-associated protease RseP (regulator of RpoE activity)